MTTSDFTIERLDPPVLDHDLGALARLLLEAVGSGAAVSFLQSLTPEGAVAWWRGVVETTRSGNIILVAREDREIVGTVQLHPAWAPNQPHRAEVVKLLVDGRCQRQGLGRRLMRAAEEVAWGAGFRLLTLDAKRGGPAERLYRQLGWTPAGTIPRYAFDPDGVNLHDTVVFYRELGSTGE